jgi:hypothetical protein
VEPAAILRLLVTAQGVKETQLQLRQLNAEAKRTADSTGRLEKEFANANNTTTKFNRNVQGLGNAWKLVKWPAVIAGAGSAAQAVGALGAASVAVASALAPLAGELAGQVGLYSALGQGVGVAKLALSGVSQALGGNKKAYQNLTPAQKTFVDQLKGMKGELKGVQQTAAQGLLPGVVQGLRIATPLIDRLRPIIGATAKEMGNLAVQAAHMLVSMGPAFQRIGQNNVQVIGNLGKAAIALGQSLIRIVDAARPLTLWMSQMIRLGAQWIDSQLKAAQASGKLANFLASTQVVMTTLGHIIGNLVVGFYNIGKAAVPLGNDLLRRFTDLTAKFREWTQSTTGKNQIAAYFQAIQPSVHQVFGLIGDLAKLVAQLFKPQPGQAALIGGLRRLLDVLGGVFVTTTRTLGPPAVKLLTNLARILGSVAGTSGPLTLVVTALAQISGVVADVVAHNPKLSAAATFMLGLGTSWKLISKLVSPLGSVAKFVVELVKGGGFVAALTKGFPNLGKVAGRTRDLWKNVGGLSGAMAALDAATLANPVGVIAASLAGLAGALALLILHFKTVTHFLRTSWGTAISIALSVMLPFIGMPLLIIAHWKPIARFFVGLWEGIKNAFHTAIHAIGGVIKGVFDGVAHGLGVAISNILGVVTGFLHVLGGALDAISNVPGLGWVSGLAHDVDHAADAIDHFREKARKWGIETPQHAKTVGLAFKGMSSTVSGAFGGLASVIKADTGASLKSATHNFGTLDTNVSGHSRHAHDTVGTMFSGIFGSVSKNTSGSRATGSSNFGRLNTSVSGNSQHAHDRVSLLFNQIFSSVSTNTDKSKQTGSTNFQHLQSNMTHSAQVAHATTGSNMGEIASIVGSKSSQAAASAKTNFGRFASNVRGGMTSGAFATYRGINYITGAVSKGLSALGSAVKVNVSLAIPKGFARGGMVDQPTYMVGEEAPRHPEVVVATNPAYRSQNIKYWAQAGKMLGMPGFEKGGIPGFKTGGYVYPFPGGTHLGRTDQGVDTQIPAGGLFRAMGDAIIGATSIGGWPGGPLMNWTLQSGPARGRMIYLAEMIRPLVHSGQHVSGNTAVAVSTGPSQEMGWWTGGPYGETLARATSGYTEGQVTAAGRSFLSFIGGGKVGPALAAIASIIAPHVHGGGYLGKLVQVALDKTTTAANAFVQAHAPVFGGGQIGGIPASTGNVERDIYKALTARGWNKVAIAAAIGNAFQESGLNPGIEVGGNGGLFGFTSGAISLSAVKSAAAARGVPWTNAGFQAAFMAAHYGDLRTLNAYRDPRQAALYFMNTFERPNPARANIPNREAAAARAYAQGYAKGGWIPPFAGSFAGGGIVPGPLGAPRTAIVHGGESISNNSGPLVAIENLNVHDDFDERALAHKLAFLIET